MVSNSKERAFHVTKCQAAVTTISAQWQFAVSQQAGIFVGLPTYGTAGDPAADVRTLTFVWYAAIPGGPARSSRTDSPCSRRWLLPLDMHLPS
jgi:hypothetical protein